MIAPGVAPQLDFAIVGNDAATLDWLRRMLAGLPGVRLIDDAERGADDHDCRTGIVLGALSGAPPDARRLAIVLKDPVAMLAERTDGSDRPSGPGRYTETVARLVASRSERPLVLAAEELAGSARGLDELLAHLGIDAPETGVAAREPGPVPRAGIGFGRHATLFSAVRDDVEELERLTGRTFSGWRFSTPATRAAPGGAGTHRLVYVGRRRDIQGPPGSVALTDWDVLPFRLAPLLNEAAALAILDPMSFPFDALRESDRAIPLAVELPVGWDAQQLIELFDAPVLGELTPFDSVALKDDGIWETLQTRYSWPATIRATERDLLLNFPQATDPNRTGSPRALKGAHLATRGVLRRQLAAARAAIPRGETERVLLLADDAERWASLFPVGDVLTVAGSEEADAETVHVALSIGALCDQPRVERARSLYALLRGLRVGGRLIVLDRFLDGHTGRLTGAPAPGELLADVREASLRHVVLEHVETLRYPGEALTSAGLFTFTKIGRPERL